MKIVGVDPAPAKGLSTFDGLDGDTAIGGARQYLSDLAGEEDLLLCWDAPLTGPPTSVTVGGEGTDSDFSKRTIEKFFCRSETGFKAPSGISVMSYSTCPHWALSRSLLGYPRVGPYDLPSESLPFRLAPESKPPKRGRHLVKVHPAVAIWLWCRIFEPNWKEWHYKKSRETLKKLWDLVLSEPAVSGSLSKSASGTPPSHDAFDARIAFLLGRLWLDGSGSVVLLGGAEHGAILLPRFPGLEEAFESFVGQLDHQGTVPSPSGMPLASQRGRRVSDSR